MSSGPPRLPRVIARTYLTFGWRYKNRILRSSASDVLKSVCLAQDLPRFVWVTKFGTVDSLNHIDVKDRSVFSHAIIDATSSNLWQSMLLFHAPGMAMRWYHKRSPDTDSSSNLMRYANSSASRRASCAWTNSALRASKASPMATV